jgi:hypothetical protein
MSTYADQDIPVWVQDVLRDFRHVAELAGCSLAGGAVAIEYTHAPHRPPSRLPPGKMAVHAFYHQGRCLKLARQDRTVRLDM